MKRGVRLFFIAIFLLGVFMPADAEDTIMVHRVQTGVDEVFELAYAFGIKIIGVIIITIIVRIPATFFFILLYSFPVLFSSEKISILLEIFLTYSKFIYLYIIQYY